MFDPLSRQLTNCVALVRQTVALNTAISQKSSVFRNRVESEKRSVGTLGSFAYSAVKITTEKRKTKMNKLKITYFPFHAVSCGIQREAKRCIAYRRNLILCVPHCKSVGTVRVSNFALYLTTIVRK